VDVASITRYTAPPVRTAILQGNSSQGASAARLAVQQQIETTLGTSPGTIGDGVESFFNAAEQLTTDPSSTALRRTTLAAASAVAGQLNAAATGIDQLRQNVGTQIGQTVSQVNSYASQIAALNTKIAGVQASGGQANDMMDQRDNLVNQLSQQMNVTTVPQKDGTVNVIADGAAVVVGNYANTFSAAQDSTGNMVISQAGSTQPVTVSSGTLGGQLQAFNQDIPATRSRLDGLAQQLITKVNAVQATGLGAAGPVTSSTAGVAVAAPTAPLATQGLPSTPTAGTLTISVTDSAGNRTNAAIAFDPATQSLNDLATAITGGTGGAVQASVDPQSGVLSLQAQGGASFDFAGRAPSAGGAAVANTDTGGLLPALGVNGLFTGTDATSIAVNPTLTADPNQLAASKTGEPGDTTNLQQLAAIRDLPVTGGRTLSGEYDDLAATVGQNVQQFGDQQSAQTSTLANLTNLEQSTTGVDTNQELVHLLDYQNMIQAGSKYLSVVNSAMDSIMQMVQSA
jgi:flagellar hook-associated protein FlgK